MMNCGRKLRLEVTVMMLVLLEGLLSPTTAASRDLELGDPSALYLSSTPLSFISDYTEEPSLAQPQEPKPNQAPTGNRSTGVKPPPIRDTLYVVIPMTLIYSLILLTGLLGNVSTCVVIARNSYMHTATNYYLFSLAISDLLLLLSGLPQEMYSIWIRYPYVFGEAFCVIRGLAAETSANATVLTITAFTVERYVAICHPLRSHKWSQLSRVVRGVKAIWFIALTLALPQAAQFGIIDEKAGDVVIIKGAWCSIKRVIIPYAFEISICVFFVVPMSIITGLYVLIGLKLWRSRRGLARSGGSDNHLSVEPHRFTSNRHSQTHVIRMLVSVVVAFFVCWAPFHAQRLLAIYATGTRNKTLIVIYDSLTHISGILYFLSTCINPILYHIMSNKFRQAFKDTAGQLCGRRSAPGLQHRTYSAISNRSSRMGIIHNNVGQTRNNRADHHDTCVNCRHTPSLCSCRGNNKFQRTYNTTPPKVLDNSGSLGDNTQTTFGASPPDKEEVVIALSNLGSKSQGSVFVAKLRKCSSGSDEIKVKCPTSTRFRKPSGLRAFLMRPNRHLRHDTKGHDEEKARPSLIQRFRNSETLPIGIQKASLTRNIVTIDPGTDSGASQSSVASGPSITSISNSSLQDLDESEYTGEELASCLATMNSIINS